MKTELPVFFHGAVDIEIKGRFSERFLNLAFQEGIDPVSYIHLDVYKRQGYMSFIIKPGTHLFFTNYYK